MINEQMRRDVRNSAAETLKAAWDFLTKDAEAVKDKVFGYFDSAVVTGRIPAFIYDREELLEFSPGPKAIADGIDELRPVELPIWIAFSSPGAKSDFLRHLRELVQDDPNSHDF